MFKKGSFPEEQRCIDAIGSMSRASLFLFSFSCFFVCLFFLRFVRDEVTGIYQMHVLTSICLMGWIKTREKTNGFFKNAATNTLTEICLDYPVIILIKQ
jgi:hypothetical protein